MFKTPFALLLLIFSLVAAACGGSDTAQSTAGIRVVSASDAETIQAEPPAGLTILDLRTPEEFASGHIEGATMIDFYAPDFRDRLEELDPTQPYLIYCRSGNRSSQTRAILEDLEFADVADVDGGIVAWQSQGLPLTFDG